MSTVICPVHGSCGVHEYRCHAALKDIISLLDGELARDSEPAIAWLVARSGDSLWKYVKKHPGALSILARRVFGLSGADVSYLKRLTYPADREKMRMVLSYAMMRHANDQTPAENQSGGKFEAA